MSQPGIDQRIDELVSEFKLLSPFFAGYPVNQDFDYSPLYPLMAFAANNVGDPFSYSRYQANTHETEREVVRVVAELMRLPPDDAWGYVTSGGTEGNMYGIYMGRELLGNPIAYFSEDTHYSVLKILHVLGIRNIMVRSQENGEAVQAFNAAGIAAWRTENSPIVVFPRPSDYVLFMWQLAPYGDIAHIVTMPHVTRDMIDRIVQDCLEWPVRQG